MEITSESERDFRIDSRAYTRRAARNTAVALTVSLVGGTLFVSSNWFDVIPWGVRVTVAALAIGIVVLGTILMPGAVKAVSTIRVRLEDEAIVYSAGELSQSLRYRDSAITRVRRRGGRVTGLHLKAADGQSMELHNFEHMDRLYAELVRRVERSKPA
jgi:hypothetical protein